MPSPGLMSSTCLKVAVRGQQLGKSPWKTGQLVERYEWLLSPNLTSLTQIIRQVDILEGANDVSPNSITLHTSPGCKMPAQRTMTGCVTSVWLAQYDDADYACRTPKQLDCDATLPGNLGCGVAAPDKKSYGKEFNQAGGGFYVMERTPAVINGWFFSRNSNISTVITSGATTLDTASLVSRQTKRVLLLCWQNL